MPTFRPVPPAAVLPQCLRPRHVLSGGRFPRDGLSRRVLLPDAGRLPQGLPRGDLRAEPGPRPLLQRLPWGLLLRLHHLRRAVRCRLLQVRPPHPRPWPPSLGASLRSVSLCPKPQP